MYGFPLPANTLAKADAMTWTRWKHAILAAEPALKIRAMNAMSFGEKIKKKRIRWKEAHAETVATNNNLYWRRVMDDNGFILPENIIVILGEVVSAAAKDPRNIRKEEWRIIDPIYKALSDEQWQDVKAVAISRSDHVRLTSGPGENSRSAKRQQKDIHNLLATK